MTAQPVDLEALEAAAYYSNPDAVFAAIVELRSLRAENARASRDYADLMAINRRLAAEEVRLTRERETLANALRRRNVQSVDGIDLRIQGETNAGS